MDISSEDITGKNKEGDGKFARLFLARVTELWIFLVIVIFIVVRVLGSHTAQRLLGGFGGRHLP